MSREQIKFYVFHYKPQSRFVSKCHCYVDIWAGKNHSKESHQLPGDDTGENISAKNKYYSELTGIYWAKENTSQDVIGSCHYRRFMTIAPEPLLYKAKRMLYYMGGIRKKRHGLIYTHNPDRFEDSILNADQIKEILHDYDAILPEARKLKYTVREHYERYHNAKDLELLRSLLQKKYPHYMQAFEQVMQSKRLFANNMFVLRQKDFEAFSTWWFDMLEAFEQAIQLEDYHDYQERIMGFMAERLLNIWFAKHKLKVKQLQVIYFKKFKTLPKHKKNIISEKFHSEKILTAFGR